MKKAQSALEGLWVSLVNGHVEMFFARFVEHGLIECVAENIERLGVDEMNSFAVQFGNTGVYLNRTFIDHTFFRLKICVISQTQGCENFVSLPVVAFTGFE
jgi:hypothetical protein